jgi:hypothetical protein
MQVGRIRALARAAAALLAASLLAACQTDGDPFVTGSILAPTHTVAIESIDGPPKEIFDRLVARMSQEAEARQYPIISRLASPNYRARISLVPEIEGRNTRIAWVAEVFDRGGHPVARLTGAEPIARGRKDPWGRVDDATLGRIAAQALTEIVGAIGGAPAPAAPRDAPAGPAVAYADPRR